MEEPLSKSNENPNIKLIYDDAESSLKLMQANIDSLNTKLGLVIGFSATFIRLSISLPDLASHTNLAIWGVLLSCYSCLILKILTHVGLIAAIGLSLAGIYPKSIFFSIRPKQLLEKGLNYPEKDFRIAVIENRDMVLGEMFPIREKKAFYLKLALTVLGISVSLAALDVIVDSIYCK